VALLTKIHDDMTILKCQRSTRGASGFEEKGKPAAI